MKLPPDRKQTSMSHSMDSIETNTSTKWRSLTILSIAEVLVLSLWFSATAVVPQLQAEFGLGAFEASLFTSSVQVGFVAGTIVSALLGLADRFDPRRFFMISTVIAAIANALILLIEINSPWVFLLRFLTGACMAGIYPVGMKIAASWAKGDLGLLVGILVGALTLGSASPHLFNALGGLDWQFTIILASIAALTGAVLITRIQLGPNIRQSPKFEPSVALMAFTKPSLRLANFGYLGHMWELYAMWAWIGVYLTASFQTYPGASADGLAGYATFATIGVAGVIGCIGGGQLADRFGRTLLTSGAMAISGICAILAGFVFGGPPVLVMLLCFVWGISIIADSAQFSASITELAPPERLGTMLTVQTSAGFLLTLASIHMMPYIVDLFSWRYAFSVLAIGPFLGVVAMMMLRRHPEAVKLAGGRR